MDIAIDKVRELILEARRLDVKEGGSDPDSGSNAIDDNEIDVLASGHGDASEREFRGIIAGLNVDERADILALLYIGRGDFSADEWDDAVALARDRDAEAGHLANYLIGTPNLPDLLDEGFAAIGDSFEDEGDKPADESVDESADNTVEIHHLRNPRQPR